MHSLKGVLSSISPRWSVIILASAFVIAAATVRAFESDGAKIKRAELKKQKELRVVAQRISAYGQTVHQQFPTGDVVISERDLAEQLRKGPDVVVTALNLLLNEQRHSGLRWVDIGS